jgi:hypothetical protein
VGFFEGFAEEIEIGLGFRDGKRWELGWRSGGLRAQDRSD